MFRPLVTVPLRLVAVLVKIPTVLSLRLLRFSAATTLRTTRAAVRSSIISFLLGMGLGWFLTTPTGRYVVALVLDAIRGRTATPVDDDTLTDRVRAALGADTTTWHLPQPDVDARGGVVTLTGEAPHDSGRLDLASVAATVDGVVSVVDRISVVDTTPASAPAPTPTA